MRDFRSERLDVIHRDGFLDALTNRETIALEAAVGGRARHFLRAFVKQR
jgi:hypothetical protein